MARLYIDGDSAKIVKTDTCRVNVTLYDGTVFEDVEPRRLFPVSGGNKYVTLLDNDNHEKAIIRDVDQLMPDSRQAILDCLNEFYLIPKIIKVLDRTEKFGILKWTVETDRGVVTFAIANRHSDIKIFYDGRILVRDSNDNRYEIPNVNEMDQHSHMMLGFDL